MGTWDPLLKKISYLEKAKAKKAKGNKYGAKKFEHKGRSFSSQAEAATAAHLELLLRVGDISELEYQVEVLLTRASILYKPDFRFKNKTGEVVYAECKGFETPSWRIKRRLWKFYGPGKLEVYNVKNSRVVLIETIEPRRIPAP